MERWVAKLISLILTFVIPFIATILPIKVIDFVKSKGTKGLHVISLLICFGGGVFFATYILHMSPEVIDLIHFSLVLPYDLAYPLAHLLMAVGFLMMLFLETTINTCGKKAEKKDKYKHDTVVQGSKEMEKYDGVDNNAYVAENGKEQPKSKDEEAKEDDLDNMAGHGHGDLRGTRSLILLFALSLHHIFEGLTVGLQRSVTNVWNLTIGIIAHEIVIAFSLGLQLVKAYSGKPCTVVIAALVCMGMSPIGLAIGMAITETGGEETPAIEIANGILQGISTGVFIYVTFFEILAGELIERTMTFSKIFSFTAGFVLLALLVLIPDDTAPVYPNFVNCTAELLTQE